MIIIITKKRVLTLVLILPFAIILLLFIKQMIPKSFQEVYGEYLNENMTIRSASIDINDVSGYGGKTLSRAMIEDEGLIQDILADFAELKLKKDKEADLTVRAYRVTMTVNYEVGENHTSTTTIHFDVDNDYLNNYKITGSTNHLKTIEAIVESEEVEWEDVD